MTVGIWWVLASRIRLRMAGLTTITSVIATRPLPSLRAASAWVTTPCRQLANWARIWLCW